LPPCLRKRSAVSLFLAQSSDVVAGDGEGKDSCAEGIV